jgi:hypothetical protein
MANIFGSVQNLVVTAGSKVDQVSTVAKGILCIPSILANLPSILGGVASSILRSVFDQANAIGDALSGIILDTVTDFFASITGSITNLIRRAQGVQAEILASIKLIKDFVTGLSDVAKEIKDFALDSENCKFAASELIKCVVANIIGNTSNKLVANIGGSRDKLSSFANDISSRIAKPGEVIDRFVTKQSSMIDKANTQIKAINLF